MMSLWTYLISCWSKRVEFWNVGSKLVSRQLHVVAGWLRHLCLLVCLRDTSFDSAEDDVWRSTIGEKSCLLLGVEIVSEVILLLNYI